jgi:GNAT superfamily N-acetyltransferase
LGPDWRYYGEFDTMGSQWFYWQHRTVTGNDRVRMQGYEPQEQPDEPYDVGETERFRLAWEKKKQTVGESKTIHRDGIDIRYSLNRDNLSITALAGGKEMGAVNFRPIVDDTGRPAWEGDNLYVDDRFRGQGIAGVMYDVARDLVGRIVPSNAQTDAGKAFWDKNRHGQEVWEEQ